MIPLNELIQLKFPTATFGSMGNVLLQDHGDGNGPIIGKWDVPNTVQPTADQLAAWQSDSATVAAYTYRQNATANKPIYDALDALDMQSIRALRTSDTARLTSIENKAIALRAKLLPVQ